MYNKHKPNPNSFRRNPCGLPSQFIQTQPLRVAFSKINCIIRVILAPYFNFKFYVFFIFVLNKIFNFYILS